MAKFFINTSTACLPKRCFFLVVLSAGEEGETAAGLLQET
jgi:hypothetical protein